MFSYDGVIYRALTKVSDVAIMHLLWLLTSIPLVTLGASTTALYHVALARRAGDKTAVSTLYFQSFRQNFLKATLLLAALVALAILLVVDLYFWNVVASGVMSDIMGVLSLALCVPWFLLFIYGFAALGYAQRPLKETVLSALRVAYLHPLRSLVLALLWVAFIALNCLTMYVNALSLLIGFGVFVYAFLSPMLLTVLDPELVAQLREQAEEAG